MQNTTNDSKGKWLTANKAFASMGLNSYTFNKIIPELKSRSKGPKKKIEYFIPYDRMTGTFREYYSKSLDDLDGDAEQVEEILGDISNPTITEDDLIAAKFDNIKARTKVLEQQLEAKKIAMFSEWSSKFYDIFATSFAKVKNELVSIHLTEEQLFILESKIELALKSMQDKLTLMETEWMNEDEENN